MTTTTLAAPGSQDCSTCGGRGELEYGLPPAGPVASLLVHTWGPNTRECDTCSGTGSIPGDALVCDACEQAFPVDEQACDHGMTLCGDDRGECSVCASEISYERGCDDPWGDVA